MIVGSVLLPRIDDLGRLHDSRSGAEPFGFRLFKDVRRRTARRKCSTAAGLSGVSNAVVSLPAGSAATLLVASEVQGLAAVTRAPNGPSSIARVRTANEWGRWHMPPAPFAPGLEALVGGNAVTGKVAGEEIHGAAGTGTIDTIGGDPDLTLHLQKGGVGPVAEDAVRG